MAAVSAGAPNPNLPQGKIAIITHHDELVKGDFVLPKYMGDGKTTPVHIGEWFDNKKTGLPVCAGTYAVMFSTGHKSDIKSAGDLFNYSKSDVMSRFFVTTPRIS